MQRKENRICNQDISLIQPNEAKQSKVKRKQKNLERNRNLQSKCLLLGQPNTKGQAKLNNNRFFGGTHQSKKVNHLSFEKIKDDKANMTKQVDKKLNNSQQKQQCKHDMNQVNILDCNRQR
jgi:hypothetical protein